MKKLDFAGANSTKNFKLTRKSPFWEKDNLLEFKPGFATPEFFSRWSFETNLYGEEVQVDHLTVTFPELRSLANYAEALCKFNGRTVEGLGIFPLEFCPTNYALTIDLWIHLETILMPSGGLVVLVAPHTPFDQLDRFLHQRGLSAVHHVAIRVEDVENAALLWQEKGFRPLTMEPLEGDSLCQWFWQNSAGQIIELISRSPEKQSNFHLPEYSWSSPFRIEM